MALSMGVLVAQTPSGKKALPKTATDTEAAIKAAADAFKTANALKTVHRAENAVGRPRFARRVEYRDLHPAAAARGAG